MGTHSKYGAVALMVAPGLMLVAQLVQQAPATHDTASELASIAAAPGRAELSAGLGFLGLLTFVPALLTLGAAVGERRARTARVGTAMSLSGVLALTALMGSAPVTVAMVARSADRGQMVALTDRYESSALVGAWMVLMLVGWVLGPVVLGVGLWRGGGRPVVPVLLIVGVVLMMIDSGKAMQAAAMAATWLALGLVGVDLWRNRATEAVPAPKRLDSEPAGVRS